MTVQMPKIGIVDGHPLMCEGVKSAFVDQLDFDVVAIGRDYNDAIDIAATHEPDIIILELELPGGGLNAVRQIKLSWPKINLVILTGSEVEENVKAALSLGVHGYILKGICAADLVKAIHALAAGETYITPTLAMSLLTAPVCSIHLASHLPTEVELSAREEQILQAVAKGLKNREIADQLRLSEKTIKNYMSGILSKLNSRNRVEAVLASLKRKLEHEHLLSHQSPWPTSRDDMKRPSIALAR
jgi:two-component system, NarL family, nitrate/nitrite response regulator NarL